MSLLRYTLILTLLAAICDKALCQVVKPHYDVKDAESLYSKFREDYKKEYTTENDVEEHYEAFVLTLLRINYLNSVQDTAVYDINEFADETEKEFKRRLMNEDKHKVV